LSSILATSTETKNKENYSFNIISHQSKYLYDKINTNDDIDFKSAATELLLLLTILV